MSAYFYCRKAKDGLCASSILQANDTDLYTFAQHWGNFGLRQFSLAYALPEDVLAAEVAFVFARSIFFAIFNVFNFFCCFLPDAANCI